MQNKGVQSGTSPRHGKIIIIIVGNQSGEVEKLPDEAIRSGFQHSRAQVQLALTSVCPKMMDPVTDPD